MKVQRGRLSKLRPTSWLVPTTTFACGATSRSTRSIPAIAHGIGTTRAARSRSASWRISCCGNRRFFGVKPEIVLKGGFPIVRCHVGDPNASIPTPQPVFTEPMFGSFGRAPFSTSLTFLSKAAMDQEVHKSLGLQKRVWRR